MEKFYTKMKSLWGEIDALDPIGICTCSGCDCNQTHKSMKSQQRMKLIQFLMKLDTKYHQTRSKILMMKDLPSVSEAYSILMQEQTHQEISKGNQNDLQENPLDCMVDKRKFHESKTQEKNDSNKFLENKRLNTKYISENCKVHGHTLEICWRVHGYPPNYKTNTWKKDGYQPSKAHAVQNDEQPNADAKLTNEQVNQLINLLNKQQQQNCSSILYSRA